MEALIGSSCIVLPRKVIHGDLMFLRKRLLSLGSQCSRKSICCLQGTQQSSDPLAAIGSALAQAAFGGGLNQPAANTATLQAKNVLGRKFA